MATPASVMPGRSGVTAPITPDSRTTGTTGGTAPESRRQRVASACRRGPAIPRDHLIVHSCRYLELTIFYHATVIAEANAFGPERLLHCTLSGCNGAAENDMKIYLLMMLIGAF